MQTALSRKEYDIWHGNFTVNDDTDKIIIEPWHKNVFNLGIAHNNRKILEAGCGRGDFSIFLSKQGALVTAMDFSAVAIEAAYKKNLANKTDVNFIVSDIRDTAFKNSSFDLIYSFECLEHIPNPQLMLNESFRVLKPNGRIVLTTENYSNAMVYVFLYNKLIRGTYDSGSGVQPIEKFLLFWNVKKMFLKAGFKNIELFGSHYVFLMLPGYGPSTFVKEEFKNKLLKFIFKPLARHMVYSAIKS